MAATHFSGPVVSTNGFIGAVDSTGASNQVMLTARPAPTTDATAGNLTITSAMLLNGILARDPAGSNRTDTLPTAALLVAALGGPSATAKDGKAFVGLSFETLIVNTADAAETITLAAGTGGTAGNTNVTTAFGQNTSKRLIFRLTNVTSGAEAYTVYA